MENLGIFFDHLVFFTAIGNILWPFGIFFPVLVFWTKKNLATLVEGATSIRLYIILLLTQTELA
jgi:hypothetical protein